MQGAKAMVLEVIGLGGPIRAPSGGARAPLRRFRVPTNEGPTKEIRNVAAGQCKG